MPLPFKLGKLPAKRSLKSLALSNYMKASSVAFPPVHAWERPIQYGMLANDRIGDCAIAAPAHMEMNWQVVANAGSPLTVTEQQAIADYSAVSGYDPKTGANDDGCYLIDVLRYWKDKGIAGRKIDGFATIDFQNIDQIKAAAYLFGGLYLGFKVPEFIMEQAPDDKVWRPKNTGTKIIGGHAVCLLGYGRGGCAVCSWGDIYHMTWDFWVEYVDEADAVVSPLWLKQSGVSPSGLDQQGLLSDLQLV